jgi:anti-anti-sigma factor
MRKPGTPVLIQRLPETVGGENVRTLMQGLENLLKSDRPRMVFDLSQVEEMDAAGVDMLLTCMTEAAKRDGDLKLAAPSPRAQVILELTQMDRLFEIFETVAEAAASFGVAIPQEPAEETTAQRSSGELGYTGDEVPASQQELRSGRKLDSDVA